MLVVLATMVVRSVMVVMLKVAMTYFATCQFTGTWWMHLQELQPTVLVADFCFYIKYLSIQYFHISQLLLLDSWASSSHKNLSYHASVLSIWHPQVGFVPQSHLYFFILLYDFLFRSMLCREASITIKSGLLSHSINERLSDKVIFYAVLYTCFLPIVYL